MASYFILEINEKATMNIYMRHTYLKNITIGVCKLSVSLSLINIEISDKAGAIRPGIAALSMSPVSEECACVLL